MEVKINIPNIKLVSNNRRLMPGRRGRFFTAPDYKACKERIIQEIKMQVLEDEIAYLHDRMSYEVTITLHTTKDIDAPEKVILDALQEAGIIKNDSMINAKHTYKYKPESRSKESLEVIIE